MAWAAGGTSGYKIVAVLHLVSALGEAGPEVGAGSLNSRARQGYILGLKATGKIPQWSLPTPVHIWWKEVPRTATASVCVPRVSCSCLLPPRDSTISW